MTLGSVRHVRSRDPDAYHLLGAMPMWEPLSSSKWRSSLEKCGKLTSDHDLSGIPGNILSDWVPWIPCPSEGKLHAVHSRSLKH